MSTSTRGCEAACWRRVASAAGRTLTDSCEIRAAVPEAATLNPYCRVVTPYLTQFKVLARIHDSAHRCAVLGTFQSIPGPQVVAKCRLHLGADRAVTRAAARGCDGGAGQRHRAGHRVRRSTESVGFPHRQDRPFLRSQDAHSMSTRTTCSTPTRCSRRTRAMRIPAAVAGSEPAAREVQRQFRFLRKEHTV